MSLPTIRVTEIGEFIRHKSCERRFKLDFNGRGEAKRLPFAERLFNPLDPVLQRVGKEREETWQEALDAHRFRNIGDDSEEHVAWSLVAARVSSLAPGQNAYAREVKIDGQVGAFHLHGRVDFILVTWREGKPSLRVVECKASRRDRTYHRIQVACYQLLLERLLEATPLKIAGHQIGGADLECVVARIDEESNESQDILAIPPFDLTSERADLLELLASDGHLARILATRLDDLPFRLESKCDGCVFSTDCFPETARQRRLELLSLSPPTVRELRAAGIQTIDDLAQLDLLGAAAATIRNSPGFTENLAALSAQAKARRRTLPGGDANPDEYEVSLIPNAPQSRVPPRAIGDQRLVRIYLNVDFDYTEARVGALSAHVTASDWMLHTKWRDPNVQEGPTRDSGLDRAARRAVRGRSIVEIRAEPWTHDLDADTQAEAAMIRRFFEQLVGAIRFEAGAETAPVHFYTWGRGDMKALMDACARADPILLGALHELLGCRESIEQLICSSLQDEVDARYALGWTGRGLAVVAGLKWYGERYHWTRMVDGAEEDLDHTFTQDIFDYKTDLLLTPDGRWAREDDDDAQKRKFEIRSRFHDNLPAPYWHALWGELPDPADPATPSSLKPSIRRYLRAGRASALEAYLIARCMAMRWIEERVGRGNEEIQKPSLDLRTLASFSLGVSSAARASLDFLRLDQQVKVNDWVSEGLAPPAARVPTGDTLPLRDVVAIAGGRLSAIIDPAPLGLTLGELQRRATYEEGSFARISPCSDDPQRGQTVKQLLYGGSTAIIEALDWSSGSIVLSPMASYRPSRYLLYSKRHDAGREVFTHATLDPSPSDFVANRVERRLERTPAAAAYTWLDPIAPSIPPLRAPQPAQAQLIESIVRTFSWKGNKLGDDQASAILEGLEARIQLLLGPPGTGKTMTTSVSVLARALAHRTSGDVILLAAHTHTAVNNLLKRIDEVQGLFEAHAVRAGEPLPPVSLAKIHSGEPDDPVGGRVQDLPADGCASELTVMRREGITILGGTTSALLKMSEALGSTLTVSSLIVDEASMMVFPHFLALATLVHGDGEIMLAGDHRQLSPIYAHDWDREDRPPTVKYQPHLSAYEAVLRIYVAISDRRAIVSSALDYTYRLPPAVRALSRAVYLEEGVDLKGPGVRHAAGPGGSGPWRPVWEAGEGVFLVVHDEHASRRSNELEAEIVRDIVASAAPAAPEGSVAVITPHRAQRVLLSARLEPYSRIVSMVNTVERLQGGEKPTIIVSGTASDPYAIIANVEFLLDKHRANVAFSRAQERLIVVCGSGLLNAIPAEHEHYANARLWKLLRDTCKRELATGSIGGHSYRLLGA